MSNAQLPFDEAAEIHDGAILDNNSRIESEDKIERLKDFYKDPYGDGSERWYMAEFALDFLCACKEVGGKRKDTITEDILHELNQLILQKSLVEAENSMDSDNHILPHKITYEIINGKRFNIPEEQQSIERLFCSTSIHDIDEDYPSESTETFRKYITQCIDDEKAIKSKDKPKLLAALEADCQAMTALTFTRKALNPDGEIEKITTFNGDRNLYMDALESLWMSVGTKVTDKLDSLTSRYGKIEDFFSISSDLSHIDEANRLFKHRQTLENASKRFPEMSNYFELIDAKLNIAHRCLECITAHHPSKIALNPDKVINPETAKIDISRILPYAFKYSEYLEKDAWMMARMISGFEAEAERIPSLKNIVTQIRDQYDTAFENYYNTLKNYSPDYPESINDDTELISDINPNIS